MRVKVSIEVRSGAAHFDVALQAESIERAMSFVKERYPKGNVKVKFPIEVESFFVEDRSVRRGIVGLEHPVRVAA
jgi:hypothetical protein